MGTLKVGELDNWEDADLGGNDFMRLEEGSNPVRVFTNPYQFYNAWVEDASGKSRKIRSAVRNCPLAARGEKLQARWYVGVLNRKVGGKPSILEIGPQIFKQIKNLKGKPAWGDPRGYDLDIERNAPGTQPLYVVSPEPKSPVTEDEKNAIREFKERVDLGKMTEPPTPEQVREQLGEAPASTEPAVSNDFGDDEDDDFDF